MPPRILVCLLAACLPLVGQEAVAQVLRARERATLDAAPGTLILLPGAGDDGFSRAFQALLQRPAVLALRVPVRVPLPGDPEALRLRAAAAPGARSVWCLVEDGTLRLLADGTEVPSEPVLLEDLRRAGFQDRASALQAYLRQHPDNLEAREGLLKVLWSEGEAGTLRSFGLDRAGEAEAWRSGKPLAPVRDLELWSAFTQAFDAAFREERWRELDLAWLAEAPPVEGLSPTLQGLYARWLPEVEGALREDPSSEALWTLWCRMSGATGSQHLGALMASLAPSPLTPASDWPPEGVAALLLAAAKTPADWQALASHYEAVWASGSHPLMDPASRKAESALQADWGNALAPLLTCELHLGASDRADALVRGAQAASRWPALPAQAAALAERCGSKALAARWAALGREAVR